MMGNAHVRSFNRVPGRLVHETWHYLSAENACMRLNGCVCIWMQGKFTYTVDGYTFNFLTRDGYSE